MNEFKSGLVSGAKAGQREADSSGLSNTQAVRSRSRAGEVGSQEGDSRGADIVECSVAVHCDAVAGTVIS